MEKRLFSTVEILTMTPAQKAAISSEEWFAQVVDLHREIRFLRKKLNIPRESNSRMHIRSADVDDTKDPRARMFDFATAVNVNISLMMDLLSELPAPKPTPSDPVDAAKVLGQ